jgi:hypothetical protein
MLTGKHQDSGLDGPTWLGLLVGAMVGAVFGIGFGLL